MDTFKKLDFFIPIFRILPLWLKILAIIWIIFSIIIFGIIVYFYYCNNQNNYFRKNKQTAVNLIRNYEDYIESLDQCYNDYIEQVNMLQYNFNSRNMFRSGVHGKSQGKLFKKYYNLIEDKTKELKRLEENYLLNEGYNSLDEIDYLTEQDKKNLISKEKSSKQKKETLINKMQIVIEGVWAKIQLNEKIINSLKKQFFPAELQD